MTAIIILNWNGETDTIACLASLFNLVRQDFIWMVVDNGSHQTSVDRILTFLEREKKTFVCVREGYRLERQPEPGTGIVYSLKENYGFAKGNNMGIALLESFYKESNLQKGFPEFYLLLNNDTEHHPAFLQILEDFAQSNPRYAALTPQIRYTGSEERIWNCGGNLFFGFRHYCYGEKSYSKIKEKEFVPANYLTGCALFARRELLGDPDRWLGMETSECYPKLLTERFFFGEEDWDFSLRMQEEKLEMGCVIPSVIYHKQGSTHKKWDDLGKTQLYYLQRFINIRQHWRQYPLKYRLWKTVYMPYMLRFFYLCGSGGVWASLRQVRTVIRNSEKMDSVSKETFLSYLKGKYTNAQKG